jgi:hypothetical protein
VSVSAVTPPAFLVMWNDIAAGVEEEYETWHGEMHLRQRLAMPGFRCARRYESDVEGAERYFTVYDLDGLDALSSPRYRALLDDLDPTTDTMMGSFRNFTRGSVRTSAAYRTALGGAARTWRVDAPAATEEVLHHQVADLVVRLAKAGGVVAAYGGVQPRTIRPFPSRERAVRERIAPDMTFDAVVVAETRTRDQAQRLGELTWSAQASTSATTGVYRLNVLDPCP